MQVAQEAQLDALRKILMLLNGETAPTKNASAPKSTLSAKDASGDSSDKQNG